MQINLRNAILLFFGLSIFLLLLIGGIIGYNQYQYIFAPNVPSKLDNKYLYIPTNSGLKEVLSALQKEGFLKNSNSFIKVADRMGYGNNTVRAGRYEIKPNWSNHQLIRHLRNGEQASVKVVLNNERLPENIAAKVSRFTEFDSTALAKLFEDTDYLNSIGYTRETLMSLFIPNTYEVYWNITEVQFVERMIKEHEAFWSKDGRKAKAERLKLTPQEVYTLASIVEKETLKNDEKPRMAGVYLNRLKVNMPLQADPTAVFARRDFTTKRVTHYHTKFDSPYNTYMYPGLPPGPISMASISSIDAVLNHEQHEYYYFCAKGDGSGYHNFAQTLAQHNQNAEIYRRNLKARGLR